MNNYKHICIVTSALGTSLGVIPLKDRYEQTLHSIKTIRDKIPDCCIVLNDVSLIPVDDYKKDVASKVDVFIDSSNNSDVCEFSRRGLKSHADLLLVKIALDWIIENLDTKNINRIFKLSGRHNITEEFDIKTYENTEGKYVFKKPVQSWISPELKLYEARLFSMHRDNIQDYISRWPAMINSCDGRFDIEHAYYKFLDRKDVIEVDNIWVEGNVALHGRYQKD